MSKDYKPVFQLDSASLNESAKRMIAEHSRRLRHAIPAEELPNEWSWPAIVAGALFLLVATLGVFSLIR